MRTDTVEALAQLAARVPAPGGGATAALHAAAALGRAELLTADYVAAGAVVIDVGTNPTPDGGLVGDVAAGSAIGRAAAPIPVPGGVGPVTTALLLQHTVASARG